MPDAPRVVVVGGGAAGMMAALFAARAGAPVTLLERNEKLGKKVYITGKGRCNVTNDCDTQTFLRAVPRNPRFLYAALGALSPDALRALLSDLGCPTKVERGNRVFPESDKASDVTRALSRGLSEAGVRVALGARVQAVNIQNGAVCGVTLCRGDEVPADRVILCTGGLSYPQTGSDGDGYRMLREAGVPVLPTYPCLVSLRTSDESTGLMPGLSLVNVRLSAKADGKVFFDELGEMLFTHSGISGPLALSLSSRMPDAPITAFIDLKPGLTYEQLDARVQRDIAAAPRKKLSGLMTGLLPGALREYIPRLAQADGELPAGQLTREKRAALVAAMKAMPLCITGTGGYEEAVITRGGADVRALNPSTMACRAVRGLYVAGELADVDALTGGYNLHIAFATGALAGTNAADGSA